MYVTLSQKNYDIYDIRVLHVYTQLRRRSFRDIGIYSCSVYATGTGPDKDIEMVVRVRDIAGTPDIVLYCRFTKDAFSHAHKRPRFWCDIPRAVYYACNMQVSRGGFGIANATAISSDSPNHSIFKSLNLRTPIKLLVGVLNSDGNRRGPIASHERSSWLPRPVSTATRATRTEVRWRELSCTGSSRDGRRPQWREP
ncbi:hypothetical protein PUN28_004800 [Cardiocondyla obscurior]|uniref:Uncharacterized protein n=1 Tax=Cardiocondyla obscurior TaxID=286306 RepID=A0AAW2GEI0_9HYME